MEVAKQNYYVGETSNQLRDGYGVYYYANRFFRYEGDWVKGKKHGHGKLLMKDGSYYEGEFKDGEIDGHGFRKWEATGDNYSGEFLKGEMHGHGVMNYADGSQYRGEFDHNQRHGTGVLTDREGNEYEGAWYKNKKHGQAVQTFFNGDEYEGDWVEGVRHGHGELNCVDGSIYEGQWRLDMFNGQGSMVHASGVTYEGLWINGKPAVEATELMVRLFPGQTHIEVAQGRKFSLNFVVVDSNKEPVTGVQGREFQVSAGYRYLPPSKQPNQSILELIEDMDEQPVPTPFGYDVLPYPLLESVAGQEEVDEMRTKRQSPINRIFGEETIHEGNSTEPRINVVDAEPDDVDNSSVISESKYPQNEVHVSVEIDDGEAVPSTNPPPAPQRTALDGSIEFHDLYLPCAPPTYRPLLHGEDGKVTPTSSVSSTKRMTQSSSSNSSVKSEKGKKKGSRNTSAASTSSMSVNEVKSKGSKKVEPEEKAAKPGGKLSPRKKSREKGKHGKKSAVKPVVVEECSVEQIETEQFQEMMNSVFAMQGDYVIIVSEVTTPPFGSHLPPAFVVLKVTAPKKSVKKATSKRSSLI